MSTYVLIPGAGGAAWYWHLLVPELRRRGHEAIAVDIREDDPTLGLPEYADVVVSAIGDRDEVVLVAQSLGGFTAPMVAERCRLSRLVLVNAMIPLPGETAGDWWEATGQRQARLAADTAAGRSTEFSIETHFLHDVPAEVVAAGAEMQREPADTAFSQPCDFRTWPDIPTTVLVGRDDRIFPAEFQRRTARGRLGIEGELMDGGHLVALSSPVGLAERLTAE